MAKEFSKIIVPVDGSDAAKKAARKALVLAKHLNIKAVALYVIDKTFLARFPAPEDIMSFNWDKFLQKEALETLNEVGDIGTKMGVSVEKKILEGIPDQEIIKAGKKDDIIIMGSKGKSALDRIFLGSISEKVVHHASSTVMIVR